MTPPRFALLAALLLGCGGSTTTSANDGGKPAPDSSSDSPGSNDGGGTPCDTPSIQQFCVVGYCVHPAADLCPSCSQLADGGTCPDGSTLQNECPTGPAMPPGHYCVTPPAPAADPYCSPTVPTSNGECFNPQVDGGDVQCTAVPCAA